MPETIVRRVVRAVIVALAIMFTFAPAASAKPLKRGSHGARVEKLQRALHLHVDGRFGPRTEHAVKRFQRRHHLTADGVVGGATWDMIRRARAHRARTARSGGDHARVRTRGSSVRTLQRKLGIIGDGVFGPATARAVRRFQRTHGLAADGIVGPATWQALGIRGRHPVLKRARLRRGNGSGSRLHRLLARATHAADHIATLPYRYGGGHRSFHDSAYDCSGSVSYVLHAIGRLSRPMDSGELMGYGASGPGRLITIYANAGHAYMIIDGRRFDTTNNTGSRWAGSARSSAGYRVRHPPGL